MEDKRKKKKKKKFWRLFTGHKTEKELINRTGFIGFPTKILLPLLPKIKKIKTVMHLSHYIKTTRVQTRTVSGTKSFHSHSHNANHSTFHLFRTGFSVRMCACELEVVVTKKKKKSPMVRCSRPCQSQNRGCRLRDLTFCEKKKKIGWGFLSVSGIQDSVNQVRLISFQLGTIYEFDAFAGTWIWPLSGTDWPNPNVERFKRCPCVPL